MSDQDIKISFKVAGGDLSAYVDQLQKKSDQLTISAIAGARSQAEAGRDQIRIINEMTAALERKSRIETQAMRSLIVDRRQHELTTNREDYTGRKNAVYADRSLSEIQKKEKILGLEGAEKENSERIKNDYRENLQVVRETERQSKITNQLSKEQIQIIRETAAQNVKAVMGGSMKLGDIIKDSGTEEKKLIATLTTEGIKGETKNQQRELLSGGNGGRGFLPSLLAMDDINRGINAIGKVVNAKTGFELISPSMEIGGQLSGALIGGLFGNSALGASIGGAAGKAIGDRLTMNANAKESFFAANNKFRGTTGNDLTGLINLENIGVSANQNINLQSEYARRRGYSDGGQTVRDVLYADRGLGVDQNTSQGLINLQRSSSQHDLGLLIGGIVQKGNADLLKGDRSFLNELVGKMSNLQRELLRSNSTVPTGTTMDIISTFNKLGAAEFQAKDPRSGNLISTINGALSNPQGDMTRALSFMALRRANPNAGLADLLEMQQQGLANPTYLKSMMDLVSGMGGSEESQRLNFAGVLGLSGNQKYASDIYYGYKSGKFKNGFSTEELRYADPSLAGKAAANTNEMERQTAEGEDRLLSKVFSDSSIKQIVDGFKSAMNVALSGAVIELNDNKGTIQFTNIKNNKISTNANTTR